MLKFSPEFAAHLASETTSLCWSWRIIRKDDVSFGFTDHDQALAFDGVEHSPGSAISGAVLDQRSGFAIDQSEIRTAITDEAISEADLDAGLYDGARVELYRVNWREPSVRAHIWTAKIGKISRQGAAVSFELVGEAEGLQRSTGRVFSRLCDASFGDARCGVDLSSFPESTTCPKTFSACRDDFTNSVNFRGFPCLIGDDAMQVGPEQAFKRDGSSRYRA